MKRMMTAVLIAAASVIGLFSMVSFAEGWEMQENGKWCYQKNGTKLTGWYWIDGNGDGAAECYYMDPSGDMLSNTVVDGYRLDANGAWISEGYVKRRLVHPYACYSPYADYRNISLEQAYNMSCPRDITGAGIEYRGCVYTEPETFIRGDTRCGVFGCENPALLHGCLYCEYHACKIPGCGKSISSDEYNCGFCRTHMEQYGIDSHRLYQEAHPIAAPITKKTSGKSTGTQSGSTTSKPAGSASSKSSSSTGTSSSYKSRKTSSYYDSYDEGYDDVYYDGEFDDVRYWRDPDYASGVDDAMEDEDWDW